MLKQTARIISTYSADTFGVCSALFELGGMVVIHDPSGCNSTYTTHDEPRWYYMDSMIYVSGLNEQDAILGNDQHLLDETIATVHQQQPAFVCLIPSQIPFMIGTDMAALARLVEQATGTPTFTLPTNNMHYYAQGIYYALEYLSHHVATASQGREPYWAKTTVPAQNSGATPDTQKTIRINLLGVTPLDFATNGSVTSIHSWATANDFTVQSYWAMGSTLADIETSTTADVNVVLSYGGLGAARVLYEQCGIPYVIGVPIGVLQEKLAIAIKEAAKDKQNCNIITDIEASCHAASDLLIGENVYAKSLALALEAATGTHYRVIVPMETDASLLRPDTLRATDECDLEPLFAQARSIIADPMYAPLAPASTRFTPLPHEAFSGRLYAEQIPNLIQPEGFKNFVGQLK